MGGELRRLAPLVVALAPWIAAAECDTGVVELDSVMVLAPSSVDFGEVAISAEEIRPVLVSNPSGLDLALSVAFDDESDPAFLVIEAPAIVAAGGSADVRVRFRPQLEAQVTATLVFTSNSRTTPRLEVPVFGVGVDRGLPDIAVHPTPVDFGSVGRGMVVREDVRISNTGVRDLIIDAVELIAAEVDAFRLVTTVPPGFVVRPGDEVFVQVAFSPSSLQDYSGEVVLTSNDPDEASFRLQLFGRGYGVPVAVIGALDEIDDLKPFDTVRFDGSASYSPTDGVDIVRYEWSLLVRPPGSTTILRGEGRSAAALETDGPRADLLLDLAGRYEVALHVVDSRGVRSATADVLRLRAVPDEDLHVQLVWDHPTADLDLHFVRGRSGLFDHATDCYFSNRFPDWYQEEPDANPRLDSDDQGGFGPENVNVVAPAPGIKTIYVHYWSAQTSGDPETTAMLRLFVRGQMAAEVSHTFGNDELLWSAVELDWPVELDAPVAITPLGEVSEYRRPF